MYFAVLQQGGDALNGTTRNEKWTRKLAVGAGALSMAMTLRVYRAVLERAGAVRVEGEAPPEPAVLVAWHHDLMMVMPERGPARDFLALPAEPRVDPIAAAAESLGFRVLREPFGEDGSPPALLLDFVRDGNRALLSADGPHAPGTLRAEPVALAGRAGAVLIPVTVEASRAITLPGGMRAPVPTATVTLRYGAPITAAGREEAAREELRAALAPRG